MRRRTKAQVEQLKRQIFEFQLRNRGVLFWLRPFKDNNFRGLCGIFIYMDYFYLRDKRIKRGVG